jgi:hypothetical protein
MGLAVSARAAASQQWSEKGRRNGLDNGGGTLAAAKLRVNGICHGAARAPHRVGRYRTVYRRPLDAAHILWPRAGTDILGLLRANNRSFSKLFAGLRKRARVRLG